VSRAGSPSCGPSGDLGWREWRRPAARGMMPGRPGPGHGRCQLPRWRRAGGPALASDWLATTDWLSLGLYTKRVKGVYQEKTQPGRLRSDINWYDWLRQGGTAGDQNGSRWRQQLGTPRRFRLTADAGWPR